MDRPVGEYINELIATAQATFRDVQVTRRDERPARALIDMEGWWGAYRIIISEIILSDGSIRYAYYVLDADNRLVHGFDNTPDVRAVKLRYGREYRRHLGERTPHQHTADDSLSLTEPMTLGRFIEWLQRLMRFQRLREVAGDMPEDEALALAQAVAEDVRHQGAA
jgi:hypothetical protein